jgi:uncharacterized membrane protein (DUF106 family)
MRNYIHIIYFVLVMSIIVSLTTFTTSTGILSLINPALAEEKEVKEPQNMKNLLQQQKSESSLKDDKVKVEFAKKDKSDSDLDNTDCKSNKILKGASNKKI